VVVNYYLSFHRRKQLPDNFLIHPLLETYLERKSVHVRSIGETKRVDLRCWIFRKTEGPENESGVDEDRPIRDMLTEAHSGVSSEPCWRRTNATRLTDDQSHK
jgi:hypothetical protein